MNLRTRKIRAWMTLNNVKVKDVITGTRVSANAVYRFIRGDMVSAGLTAWFVAQGCPSKDLAVAKTPPKKTAKETVRKAA